MFAPNSTIRLMKGVPLDSTYRNTIWFDTEEEQTEHFLETYDYRLFSNQTYQRYGRGTLRISALADELYDYNYLAFRNNVNGTQGKIFYCFINSVEYIAERTTEVKYEIDYMQTYFFDYSLGDCFVEREHSVTDEIGENIIPEGLELGEYISGAPSFISNEYNDEGVVVKMGLNDLRICIASSFDINATGDVEDTENAVGGIYNGLPSGLSITSFEINDEGIEQYNEYMKIATNKNKIDGIVSVFLAPTSVIIQSAGTLPGIVNAKEVITKIKNYSLIHRSDNNPIKNNKLYTSPFNFLYVTNMQGNSACFPYEFFEGNECTFQWFSELSPNPCVALVPMFYKGVTENYDEKMLLSGYPQISYNVDTYKAWLAQNRGTLAVEALSIGATVAVGAITGGASLYATSLIGTMGQVISRGINQGAQNTATGIEAGVKTASLLAAVHQKSIMPDHVRGGGDPLIMAAANLLNFMFMPKYIRPEFVTIIDDYFNMYGYSTKIVKKPNTHSRPFWNYVKTVGCNVLPYIGLPSTAINAIKNIYDNGVTFWKPSAIIGDYSQDNRVV